MIFEAGQSYKNNIGTYTVLAIHNDMMDVRYEDGREQALSIKTQSRIYENRAITQLIINNPIIRHKRIKGVIEYNLSDYWTLGFLLVRLTYLEHKVMYDKQDEARIKYFDATGEELDDVKKGVFYYRKGTNQWGNQGIITFHANNNELNLLNFKGTPSPLRNSLDTYIVSDINFFYLMINNGFRLGSKQNTDDIKGNVPEIYQESFNKGYLYAQR